ncbi:MAG: glycosyltransferase, partial [Actinomyces oris]
ICLGLATFVLVKKLIDWNAYPVGEASRTVGLFFLGSIQLFFIGILGEYILSINGRVVSKPRVVIGERLNFGPSEGPSSFGGGPTTSQAGPSAQERPGGNAS